MENNNSVQKMGGEINFSPSQWDYLLKQNYLKPQQEFRKDLHFSTGKDDWKTPEKIIDYAREQYSPKGFNVDLAASNNHVCAGWFGPNSELWENVNNNLIKQCTDSLDIDWSGWRNKDMAFWLNPPYSRGLQAKFVAKAMEQTHKGCRIVMLLPARTDTRLFHDYIWDQPNRCLRPWVAELDFLKGRIVFEGAKNGAPFPSMIVVFDAKIQNCYTRP